MLRYLSTLYYKIASNLHLKSNRSTRAIRKGDSVAFPLLTQLTLLIIRRSAHPLQDVLIHASMIRPYRRGWPNCYIKIETKKGVLR